MTWRPNLWSTTRINHCAGKIWQIPPSEHLMFSREMSIPLLEDLDKAQPRHANLCHNDVKKIRNFPTDWKVISNALVAAQLSFAALAAEFCWGVRFSSTGPTHKNTDISLLRTVRARNTRQDTCLERIHGRMPGGWCLYNKKSFSVSAYNSPKWFRHSFPCWSSHQ